MKKSSVKEKRFLLEFRYGKIMFWKGCRMHPYCSFPAFPFVCKRRGILVWDDVRGPFIWRCRPGIFRGLPFGIDILPSWLCTCRMHRVPCPALWRIFLSYVPVWKFLRSPFPCPFGRWVWNDDRKGDVPGGSRRLVPRFLCRRIGRRRTLHFGRAPVPFQWLGSFGRCGVFTARMVCTRVLFLERGCCPGVFHCSPRQELSYHGMYSCGFLAKGGYAFLVGAECEYCEVVDMSRITAVPGLLPYFDAVCLAEPFQVFFLMA